MPAEAVATVDGPGKRRDTWSLKNIVEDVAGRPITDFQDPNRTPGSPSYLKVRLGGTSAVHVRDHPGSTAGSMNEEPEVAADPVDRVYPPLTGPTARELHGPEHQHHELTLQGVASTPEPPSPGRRSHGPGPSQRPERIYLHYLLLHLDRLGDPALRYLRHAVDEELRQRESPPSTPPS